MQYAGATIFESLPEVKKQFPIRGNVEPYVQFVKEHPHFLVLGTPNYPEDWLIPKLLDDGADLKFKGELRQSSYKDSMIFEVKLRDENMVQAVPRDRFRGVENIQPGMRWVFHSKLTMELTMGAPANTSGAT